MQSIRNSIVLSMLFAVACCGLASAQQSSKPTKSLGNSKSFGLGGGALGLQMLKDPVSFEATFSAEQSGQRGKLSVTATVEEAHYIFSTTQPKAGPMATVIEIQSPGITTTGPFIADRDPVIVKDMEGHEGIPVEKFFETVTWTAPVTFEKQIVDDSQTIELKVSGQVCRPGACIPIDGTKVTAAFTGFYSSQQATPEIYRDPLSHADWTAQVKPAVVAPGQTATLEITATPDLITEDGEYHVYPLATATDETSQRTLIAVTQSGTLNVGQPKTDAPIGKGLLDSVIHVGPVTWSIPIKVPADKSEGSYPIAGVVGYQTCTLKNCDQPLAFQFSGEVRVGKDGQADSSTMFAMVEYDRAKAEEAFVGYMKNTLVAGSGVSEKPLSAIALLGYFATAMLGGFILNFMPCVLPVIALKVVSFMDEAHGDSRKVAALNIWYTLGVLTVFVSAAIATIVIQQVSQRTTMWGEQFQNFPLQLGIAILLTAMALSFLGVWEIPIPGFATGSKANELSQRQGIIGAFTKGLIATILAIPCSGPMLGPVFALTLSQPAWIILLLFVAIGLGMALPYIVFASYPSAMRFLPKPGNWMVTFKQLLAFPLLLSVVWFISNIEVNYRIAAITIVVMVGMACWLIGKVPTYAEIPKKFNAWLTGLGIVAVTTWFSLTFLGPNELIEWEPYNEAELQAYVAEGKPVMIDFTASWCSSCKWNSLWAIETEDVAASLKAGGVVPMLADLSKPNERITRKVHELESNSIPLLVIYPGGTGSEPVVLRDLVKEGQVLDAIKQAVALSDPSKLTTTANKEALPAMTQVTAKSVSEKTSVAEKPVEAKSHSKSVKLNVNDGVISSAKSKTVTARPAVEN
jgi:suppressor for copper-sensitivity B